MNSSVEGADIIAPSVVAFRGHEQQPEGVVLAQAVGFQRPVLWHHQLVVHDDHAHRCARRSIHAARHACLCHRAEVDGYGQLRVHARLVYRRQTQGRGLRAGREHHCRVLRCVGTARGRQRHTRLAGGLQPERVIGGHRCSHNRQGYGDHLRTRQRPTQGDGDRLVACGAGRALHHIAIEIAVGGSHRHRNGRLRLHLYRQPDRDQQRQQSRQPKSTGAHERAGGPACSVKSQFGVHALELGSRVGGGDVPVVGRARFGQWSSA